MILKTKAQLQRLQRDKMIYNDFKELASIPGNSKTAIAEFLAEKYGLNVSTIHTIRHRLSQQQ